MITSYTFGRFVVDGERYESNIILISDKVSEGRYLEGHILKIDDFEPLVNSNPEIILIGTGESGVVHVGEDIQKYIEDHKIKLIAEPTGKACQIYNNLLKEGKKVAAFLHNTC